jgi:hypothetical protein
MIKPFQNETETFQIDQLTVENRLDRVQLYGSIEITRDNKGLESARKLKSLLDNIVQTLSAEELPDEVVVAQKNTIANPFL